MPPKVLLTAVGLEMLKYGCHYDVIQYAIRDAANSLNIPVSDVDTVLEIVGGVDPSKSL